MRYIYYIVLLFFVHPCFDGYFRACLFSRWSKIGTIYKIETPFVLCWTAEFPSVAEATRYSELDMILYTTIDLELYVPRQSLTTGSNV